MRQNCIFMNTGELIDKISKGDKRDIKEAIHYIKKLPKPSRKRYPLEYKKLLFWAIKNFAGVKNPINQVAILKALQFPLTCLGSKNYEDGANFLLKALQNSDGRVREQAYHAANWFLMDITPDRPWHKKGKNNLEEKTRQFVDFILKIDKAAEGHKHEARGQIYLNDMKPCVYKSLQKFLRRITTNEWLLKVVHAAGYVESPTHSEIFADDSNYWEVTPPHLELHEMEFVTRVKKGEKRKKKSETGYQFKVSLFRNEGIYRIIHINPKLSLYSLAEAIIDSFEFDLDHCFGFFNQYANGSLYNSIEKYELFTDLPDVEPTGAGSVEHTKIKDVWTHIRKKMYFLFDYGDNWIFEVDLVDLNTDSIRNSRRFYEIIKSVGKSPKQYLD